ncbi:hypothetical protein PENTCL1PPCAC_11204, partial [Pristionchus entomophagus]
QPTPSMSRLPPSDRPKGHIPVGDICDMINQRLRGAKVGKVSVDRIHEDPVVPEMDRDELMEFIKTHIETGDIFGILIEKNAKSPFLEYREEGGMEKKDVDRLSRSMANAGMERSEKRRGEKWREDEKRREEDKNWRSDQDEKDEKMARKLKDEVKREFPFIRHLPYLIYLLQKVVKDKGKDPLRVDSFKIHLDDLVGGSFDYSLFGLTVFAELIYHRLVIVVHDTIGKVTVRLNTIISEDKCKVELVKGYLAGQIYNYLLKKGPSSYKELYKWMDKMDSQYLHEQFPKWKEWVEDEKIIEVRAQYKSHWEVFIQKEDDVIDVNPSFIGLVASPFLDY